MSKTELTGWKKRVQNLCEPHERLLGAMIIDESDEGAYAIVLRDWDHPYPNVDGDTFSVRYAYLTFGDGNDGWKNKGDSTGGNGINCRVPDRLEMGEFSTAMIALFQRAHKIRTGQTKNPLFGDLRGGK